MSQRHTPSDAATHRVIDLSHEIAAGLITYPGLPAPSISPFLARKDSPHRIKDFGTFPVRAFAEIGYSR